MLLYKPNSRNYASTAVHLAVAWSSVAWCRTVEVSSLARHFGTSADISAQFGNGAEMFWVRSVLSPQELGLGQDNLDPRHFGILPNCAETLKHVLHIACH